MPLIAQEFCRSLAVFLDSTGGLPESLDEIQSCGLTETAPLGHW